jgi:hypothetical protein
MSVHERSRRSMNNLHVQERRELLNDRNFKGQPLNKKIDQIFFMLQSMTFNSPIDSPRRNMCLILIHIHKIDG